MAPTLPYDNGAGNPLFPRDPGAGQ